MVKSIAVLAALVAASAACDSGQAATHSKVVSMAQAAAGVQFEGRVSSGCKMEGIVTIDKSGNLHGKFRVKNKNRWRGYTAGIVVTLLDKEGRYLGHYKAKRGLNARGWGRPTSAHKQLAVRVPDALMPKVAAIRVDYGHDPGYRVLKSVVESLTEAAPLGGLGVILR